MVDLEVKVLSEMAKLEYNLLIKDELRELTNEGEYEMTFKLAYNHTRAHADGFPEYRITKPHKLINAINPSEEARKKAHNKRFRFDNYTMFN